MTRVDYVAVNWNDWKFLPTIRPNETTR